VKKPLIAGACLLVIVFATCRLWPRGRRVTSEMVNRPRVCEACGARFEGPTDPVLLPCPSCGKRAAVQAHSYVCRGCGERFEAFWERPADPAAGKPDPLKPPEMVYRRPGSTGGEWVPSVQQLGAFQCPKCGSDNVGPPRPE
jgi:predicted RNA-binding Zn-ribbon protein involved in translation (DUF1610 family)